MKKIHLIPLLFILCLTACKNDKSAPADSPQEEVNNDESAAETEDPLCADLKDMAAALPKLDTYADYDYYGTICLPKRAYGFEFEGKNGADKKFTIILYDLKHPDNKDFIKFVTDGYSEAALSKDKKIIRTSTLIGSNAFVTALNNPESVGGTFNSFIKDDYYLHFIINNDASVASPDAVEAFLKEFVSKIDSSKLK